MRPRLLQPADQTVVTVGRPFAVRGVGCPPRADVRLRVGELALGTTTADAQGAFDTTARTPESVRISDRPEAGEGVLIASCGDQELSALIVLQNVGPRLLQPTDQTGVTVGRPFRVRGVGCPARALVRLRVGTLALGQVRAGAAGAFSTTVRVPETVRISDSPEAGEAMLVARCGDEELTALVVLENPR